jgi:hypothetical protein
VGIVGTYIVDSQTLRKSGIWILNVSARVFVDTLFTILVYHVGPLIAGIDEKAHCSLFKSAIRIGSLVCPANHKS